MIDIIIPAYNSKDTIYRCLDSIIKQDYKDYKITIVNDGGDYNYDLSNYNATELHYLENKGPGYARNYGLKHTTGDFVLFIDADDYILDNALSNLVNSFEDNTGLVIGNIVAENSDDTTRVISRNLNFMHGKMYRRAFLDEYNILSNENSRCCEDDSFNSLCVLCLGKYKEKYLELPVYRWTYTKGSLGRTNAIEWEYKICPQEMLNNKMYVYKELEKRNIHTNIVDFDKTKLLVQCIVNYLFISECCPEYTEINYANVVKCYKEVYSPIKSAVTKDMLSIAIKAFDRLKKQIDLNKVEPIIKELNTLSNLENVNIDIIIPCYNSHDVVDRAIASVATQTMRDHCKVYLVNDGGNGYADIVYRYSNILDIKQLGYSTNRGTAVARNYGLDHSNSKYVMFIDSDDALANPMVIATVLQEMESDENIAVLSCKFVEQISELTVKIHEKDTSFMHGKVYRRSFLDKYKLRQNENSRYNEDVGFNLLALLCANYETEKIIFLDYIAYYWLFNSNSIVRKDKETFDSSLSFQGFAENLIFLFDELEKRGQNNNRILMEKVTSMQRLINMYAVKTVNHMEFQEANYAKLKEFYDKVYKPIQDSVTNEMFVKAYQGLNLKGDHEKNIQAIYTFLHNMKAAS